MHFVELKISILGWSEEGWYGTSIERKNGTTLILKMESWNIKSIICSNFLQ